MIRLLSRKRQSKESSSPLESVFRASCLSSHDREFKFYGKSPTRKKICPGRQMVSAWGGRHRSTLVDISQTEAKTKDFPMC
jgi:hypothetical protein